MRLAAFLAAALLCLALWAGGQCSWDAVRLGGYVRASVVCGRGAADVYVAWRRR